MEKVLIVGGGGREHALGWSIAKSPRVGDIFFAPGNGGTETIGKNIALNLKNHDDVIRWSKENAITFVVVAPDNHLADGMVDSLNAAGISCFGPTKKASKIEWSKAYAKEVMRAAGIPTAHCESFTDYSEARAYVFVHPLPVVIKASGLALGKGVVIAESREDALQTLRSFMLDGAHGEAGKEVVIEEFLVGREFSTHALCDGETALMFPPSQDHKRVFNNDEGPNTGGMGTIAPLPWVSETTMEVVRTSIVEPLMKELTKRRSPFRGLLYPGLMMTAEGPKVIEFNARFGDPETESYVRLLKSDMVELLKASADGSLHRDMLRFGDEYASCVVLASGGYPGEYEKGKIISGIEEAKSLPGVAVFHAGTKREGGQMVTDGGRVLHVTALGATLKDSITAAYRASAHIRFDGMQYRTDIGYDALNRGAASR